MAIEPGSFPSHPPAFPGPYQPGGTLPSAVLPKGRWNMMFNGRIYYLDIHGVNGTTVDAELSSGQVSSAEWDPTKGQLSFYRVEGDLKQLFRGFLMQYSREDKLWRMAGVYGDVTVGERAGWYGTQPR